MQAVVTVNLNGPDGNIMAVGTLIKGAIRKQVGSIEADQFHVDFIAKINAGTPYETMLDWCAEQADVTYIGRD